ncbi:unnamed protein product [Eruca vesicaria subsp. sativa]|uniref:F-box domain-containing protein n=1 Tax=Eruca vesicaria subsp. sativa TaxID=29727 RepID=A0ABC8LTI1_ERUVS|nr:unnamed protein product [Eruca vesicaria subsp. sativa]
MLYFSDSKIGGESSRKGYVVNEDKLSALPDDLLMRILSPLRTEDVMYTSFLSKRWRYLWKMVPNLKFDSYYSYAFSEHVYRSLALHKAPFLERLHLKIKHKRDAVDVGIWLGVAFSRNLRQLVLSVFFMTDDLIRFPGVLCSWNNTLEFLKLKHCILLSFPSRVCLMSLRKLHLHYVMFKDEESVCNLLSGCPRLEDLVVFRGSYVDVKTFTIDVPSLQRLTMEEDNPVERDGGGYVINAPSLKYLNMSGFVGREVLLIENLPELVEAKIVDIKYPTTGSIFCQLVSLEICTCKKEWWNLLARMLDSSPKLQILKLVPPCDLRDEDCPVSGDWNQPKCVPECLLFHLETFVWKRYKWQREDEKEVATYILQNARQLKKATLSTKPIKSSRSWERDVRCSTSWLMLSGLLQIHVTSCSTLRDDLLKFYYAVLAIGHVHF